MWSLQLRSFKDHFLVPLLHTLDTIASFKKQKIVPHHVLFCYMCANMPISNFIEEVAFGWKSFRLTWCKAKRLHSHPNCVLSNVTRIVLMFSSCDVMVSTQKRKIQFYLAICFNGRRNNSGKLEMNDFDFRQLIYFDFSLAQFRTQNEIEQLERWSAQMMIECIQLESRRLSIFKSFVT